MVNPAWNPRIMIRQMELCNHLRKKAAPEGTAHHIHLNSLGSVQFEEDPNTDEMKLSKLS